MHLLFSGSRICFPGSVWQLRFQMFAVNGLYNTLKNVHLFNIDQRGVQC